MYLDKSTHMQSGNGMQNAHSKIYKHTILSVVSDLYFCDSDYYIFRLFDIRTMSISHNFPRKQYIQMCCDVSSDGNYCLTCSNGFGGNGCEATVSL